MNNEHPITIDTVKIGDSLFIYLEKHGGIEAKVRSVLRKKVKLQVTYRIPTEANNFRCPHVAELSLDCFARTKEEAEERFSIAKAKKDAERATDIDMETT